MQLQRHRRPPSWRGCAPQCKPVYDKFAASYDPAVVTLFKSELERVSKL